MLEYQLSQQQDERDREREGHLDSSFDAACCIIC